MRIRGVYDGEKVLLLEPVSLTVNTEVEVVIPEEDEEKDDIYWSKLTELGLVTPVPVRNSADEDFAPVEVRGEPISQTIIDRRR